MATSRLFNIPQIAPFQGNLYLTYNWALNILERGLNGGKVLPFHPEEVIDWNDLAIGDPISNNENVFLAINNIDYLGWNDLNNTIFPPMGIRLPHAKSWQIYNRVLYVRNDDPHWPIVVMSRYDEGYYEDTLHWLMPGQVGAFFSDGLNLHVLHKRFGDGTLNEGQDEWHYFKWWMPNWKLTDDSYFGQSLPCDIQIDPTTNPVRAYTRGMPLAGNYVFYIQAGFFSTLCSITFNGTTPHAGAVSYTSMSVQNITGGGVAFYHNGLVADLLDIGLTVELAAKQRPESYWA
jgi:hypothetical protein